ncbi:MAG: RdgB/HAM1 family non-canonical purine NTP pyrophosphatase [Bacteroidota bacterium]
MKEIIFATNNDHKLKEVRDIISNTCSDCNVKILSLEEVRFKVKIPETQNTLEGNAVQKARFIRNHTGFDCFADDTGLEIEALNGEPGVYSARYAGEKASFADNVRKVLKKLNGIKNRKARFRTVIAMASGDNDFIFEGIVEGTILDEPRGKGGFGYDPVFRPKNHIKSFGEMSDKQKNKISHRYHATASFVEWIKNQYKDK